MGKHKKKVQDSGAPVELNVMPFIDIFSLLCTFLLFSAVFVSIGILDVQVPFLTNAAPSEEEIKKDKDPKKELIINISIESKEIVLRSSIAEEKEKIEKFERTMLGVTSFHQSLLALKKQAPDSDKVTLFTDDSVEFKDLVPVLDAIKFNDYSPSAKNEASNQTGKSHGRDLFPKVVMGSVIL